MKIGVIGLGTVGKAVFEGLKQIGNNLTFYDKSASNSSIDNVLGTEIIFICVPTDTVKGSCDTSIVTQTVWLLNDKQYSGIVAIKSTVTPGTTQSLIELYPNLKICFVPEFLRAKSALSDFIDEHDVLIVGTDCQEIFNQIVKCHGIIPKSTIQISPTEAELSKYFSNVYNALRIVFANSMYDVCDKLDADYQHVLKAVTKRQGIPVDYLLCSDSYRGFAGHCLPKDTEAFANFVKQLGLTHLNIFSTIVNDNKKFI